MDHFVEIYYILEDRFYDAIELTLHEIISGDIDVVTLYNEIIT